MQFKRKENRLPLNEYTGQMYYLTLCTNKRNKYFTNDKTINNLLNNLKTSSLKYNFEIWAYAFMPDHLHLLTLSQQNNSLINFIKNFKQLTGFYFKKETGYNLWQKSFYDHVVRREEDVIKIIKYIFENPVRAGIVEDFKDYPYLGSFIFDLDNL